MKCIYLLVTTFMIASFNAFAMGGPPQSSNVVAIPPSATDGAVVQGEQVVRISAKQFEFIPSKFTVKKGMPVKVILTSEDVTHGFAIDAFKVNITASKDEVATAVFTPYDAGTYDYYCSVFCGIGHMGMRGRMIVE